MPRTGVAYRAYFIGRTFVTWFDSAANGGRTWSKSVRRDQLWPSLRDPFPDVPGKVPDSQYGAYPASGTALNMAGQFVDVAKGSAVPDPRSVKQPPINLNGQPVTFGLPTHVVSWDAGPILMAPNMMGSPDWTNTPVDLRDFSSGTPEPTLLPGGMPMIAIPGEPVRWFTPDTPQQVATLGIIHGVDGFPIGFGPVNQPISTVFPLLPAGDRIVDATIMYGAHWAALAVATSPLTDVEVRAVVAAAPKFAASGEAVLAMLHLLSGLRPDAYHPAGSYGIAAMTPDQLRTAGWTEQPEDFLRVGVFDQIGFMEAYLGTFTWHADIAWALAVLLSGHAVDDLTDAAVVYSEPYPPRLRGFAATGADGVVSQAVTVGDLRAAINAVLAGPLGWELHGRAAETTLA
jgi:hypothetical protein